MHWRSILGMLGWIAAAPLMAQTPPAAPDAGTTPPAATVEEGVGEQPATPPLAIPADSVREQTIAAAIVQQSAPSEVVWLEVDGTRVLALYHEQTMKRPRGAVLLLHGMEGNPDEPEVIRRLREALPKAGWSVLTVQLPLLPADSPREAYGGTIEAGWKRVQAALAELEKRKQLNIAIVGQDLGAALAMRAATADKKVIAVAAMSLSSSHGLNPAADVLPALETLKTPVLEISGAFATPAQHQLAERRAAAARDAQHPSYTQVVLAGTDDMLVGVAGLAANRVRAWLNKNASGVAVRPPGANTGN